MKNIIYRRLKQIFILLSICATLVTGPVGGYVVSKMLEDKNKTDAQIREIEESDEEKDRQRY